MLKFVRWGLIAVVGLIVLAFAVVYGGSEIIIRSRPETPMPAIVAAGDPAAVARGAYIGRISGCDGCHTRNLQGQEWHDSDFWNSRLYTANLTRVVPHYTDSQLARAIRSGVRADGTRLWSMPSETWTTMTDAEVADVIAWLRTHPAAGPERPRESFGPLGRLKILLGMTKSIPDWVAVAKAEPAFDAGPSFARGRHLARTVCSECHRSNLKGEPGWTSDLLIAASYDLPGFTKFMRTGVAMDGKDKGLMSEVARENFSAFTDADIAALHAYLTARAEKAPG
jgi:mono/diheme cytochrome c family protein